MGGTLFINFHQFSLDKRKYYSYYLATVEQREKLNIQKAGNIVLITSTFFYGEAGMKGMRHHALKNNV